MFKIGDTVETIMGIGVIQSISHRADPCHTTFDIVLDGETRSKPYFSGEFDKAC